MNTCNYNLKPVSTEKRIVIKADVPDQLIGTFYLRNGANSYLKDVDSHIFDGDGMIHCIQFKKGKIIYHNRWIRTHRFKLEKKYKKPLFVRLAKLNTIEIFTKFFNKLLLLEDTGITDTHGEGTANTNIIYHHNSLFALNEMDKPYLLTIDKASSEIRTIGRHDFRGKLHHNINAHPKIDPDTQDMYTLGYDIVQKKCYISVIDKYGTLTKTTVVPLNKASVIHDLGLTRNYLLILDLSLEFSLSNVLFSQFPIHVNKQSVSRFGLLDKNGSKITWVYLDNPEVIFHIANSWENDNGDVILYAFCYDTNTLDVKHLHTQRPRLKKFVIDIQEQTCSSVFVSNEFGEFPVIREHEVGKKSDIIYYSRISDTGLSGIIQHNVVSGKESFVPFPQNTFGSESAIYGDYIVNVVYCIITKRSRLLIYNIHTFELVADTPLKCRIPFGFHCKIIELSS